MVRTVFRLTSVSLMRKFAKRGHIWAHSVRNSRGLADLWRRGCARLLPRGHNPAFFDDWGARHSDQQFATISLKLDGQFAFNRLATALFGSVGLTGETRFQDPFRRLPW